jgi:2-polyprenyl-3-methyl-5-hydroxy-6-metoxy-1,4-benzoquinol methylase
MTEPSEDRRIRATPRPHCHLCGGEGRLAYSGLQDRLFDAEGSWNLKRCADPDCGLIWLDPMPLPEDLGKAYTRYYTHAARDGVGRSGLLKRFYWAMKRGYCAVKYNYQPRPVSLADRLVGKLLYLFPLRRSEVDADARYLPVVPGGRVLDVGCGSGDWLALMKEMGWRVAGVDFDQNAVKIAQERGLDVVCGALEQQKHPDDSFDAVTLNHVIEHVPNPIETVKECLRILKPGGTLVVLTPNASSATHRIFKQDWRGLEPPRHLHIFSTRSLRDLHVRAGFKNTTIRPYLAASVIYESIMLRRGSRTYVPGQRRTGAVGMLTRVLMFVEHCVMKLDSSTGDCMAAIAIKS